MNFHEGSVNIQLQQRREYQQLTAVPKSSTHRVTAVQRVTASFKGVQVLDIVLCFIGCIGDSNICLPPHLYTIEKSNLNVATRGRTYPATAAKSYHKSLVSDFQFVLQRAFFYIFTPILNIPLSGIFFKSPCYVKHGAPRGQTLPLNSYLFPCTTYWVYSTSYSHLFLSSL